MKNFIHSAEMLTVQAPYAVLSGQGVLVGSLFGVAAYNAAQGEFVEIKRVGVFEIDADAAKAGAPGVKIYWDDAARRLTTTAAGGSLIGALVKTKAAGEPVMRVLLDGVVR